MSPPTTTHSRVPQRAALGSFLGSTVEYYDFMLYGTASALVFNEVFFPNVGPVLGTLSSVVTFGVGYIARPIGSVVLGHFGDRVGRRRMLLFTVVLMGAATLLMGALPGYATIGIAAPIALVVLRLVQGFSAAGEQAGANAMSLEHAPDTKRALYTSWTMAGTQFGQLLGTLIFLFVALMPHDALIAWGWRLPFLATGVLVVIVFWIRRSVPEPEVFAEVKKSGRVERFPVIALVRGHWPNMIRVVLCSVLAVLGTIISVFGLAYATKTVRIPPGQMLVVSLVTGLVGAASMPLFAILADRIGRRPVFVAGMIAAAIAIFPYFAAIGSGNIWLVAAAALVLTLAGSAAGGLQPALYTEMFDAEVRFSGVAISTQFGLLLAGFAPAIGFLLLRPGPTGWLGVAAFTSICALISAGAAYTARETRTVTLRELGRPAPDTHDTTITPTLYGPARSTAHTAQETTA
jgi:MFS family permease